IPRLQSKLSVVATAVSCARHLMLPPFWNVLLNVGNASFSFPTSTLGATRQKPWVLPKTRCRFGAPIYRWVGTPSSSYKMPRSFCGTDFVPFTNALPSSKFTRHAPHTQPLRSLCTQRALPQLEMLQMALGTPSSSLNMLCLCSVPDFVSFTIAFPSSKYTRHAPHTQPLRSLCTQSALPRL